MSKKVLSDAGVGRAMFATRVRLSLKAAEMCLFYGALPGFALPIIYWWSTATPSELSIVRLLVFAKMLPGWMSLKMHFVASDGVPSLMLLRDANGTIYSWVSPRVVAQVFADHPGPMQHAAFFFRLAVLGAVIGYGLIWYMLRRAGSGTQDNTRIRGALELVSHAEIARKVRELGVSPYSFATVRLPRSALAMGILAQGAQRSGKSMAIHDLMLQVFARKRKAIIYDYSGEFFQAHFRPGIDHFFNPSLQGSVRWSIFSELRYKYDANTLARAFLPPADGGDKAEFFRDAARALFSVLLVRLTERGAVHTPDLARAFLEMPAEEMDRIIQASVASSAIGGDSKTQRQGVLSSISIYLDGISAVGEGDWTIRDWLAQDDDSRLFIVNTEDTAAMFDPLYRLMLTISYSQIAAQKQIVHQDRYWFFLDELMQLGDIRLDDRLATVGKYGVCTVVGMQSDSQVVAKLGQARADTVLNCLNTALLLLSQENSLQKRAALRLGEMEVNTVNRNQALAVTEARDGAGLNNMEAPKWVVMPSQFGTLKPLTGYLKIASLPGVFVNYRKWNQRTFLIGPYYREAWRPRQDLPIPDESFLIQRPGKTASFEEIRAEINTEREADQVAAAAATEPAAARQPPATRPSASTAGSTPTAPTAGAPARTAQAKAPDKPPLRLVTASGLATTASHSPRPAIEAPAATLDDAVLDAAANPVSAQPAPTGLGTASVDPEQSLEPDGSWQ